MTYIEGDPTDTLSHNSEAHAANAGEVATGTTSEMLAERHRVRSEVRIENTNTFSQDPNAHSEE